jgi:hypothetical protein
MSQLYFMYSLIFGIVIVLLAYYLLTIACIYCEYRKCGLTRKQAILSVWRMQNE